MCARRSAGMSIHEVPARKRVGFFSALVFWWQARKIVQGKSVAVVSRMGRVQDEAHPTYVGRAD